MEEIKDANKTEHENSKADQPKRIEQGDNPNLVALDHRQIGKSQKLFMFHESSPGSCFFLPHGTKIYNKLVEFLRGEYNRRGFSELITPTIYNAKLWKISGHWQHYRTNMFNFCINDHENEENEKDEINDSNMYALKPMNCCAHCIVFGSTNRSYRELPLRFADFGVLHRNEMHGALTGLTRVRKFSQDDAHLFCTYDQISDEINNCLEFVKYVYGIFGFEYSLALSTRPDDFIGEIEVWNQAEQQLMSSLNMSKLPWTLDPQGGAFYGPKIDISIKDSAGKMHQCATIQLDFNLPERFGLKYQDFDGSEQTPVMIHRAILGSVERMFAILCEHYEGKWPFWLSPRQICIIPVDPKFREYASEVVFKLYHDCGFNVEVDLSRDGLNKKIRNAQIEQFNFIFVVGEKEKISNTVNVRNRNGKIYGQFSHDQLINNLNALKNGYILEDVIWITNN